MTSTSPFGSFRFGSFLSALFCSGLSFLTMVVLPATAHADSTVTASQVVRVDDLNLSSTRGVATLYRRLERAADVVCGPAERTGSRIVATEYRDCVAQAMAAAVAKVDRPSLSVYHAQRHSRYPVLTSTALNR